MILVSTHVPSFSQGSAAHADASAIEKKIIIPHLNCSSLHPNIFFMQEQISVTARIRTGRYGIIEGESSTRQQVASVGDEANRHPRCDALHGLQRVLVSTAPVQQKLF